MSALFPTQCLDVSQKVRATGEGNGSGGQKGMVSLSSQKVCLGNRIFRLGRKAWCLSPVKMCVSGNSSAGQKGMVSYSSQSVCLGK